MSTFKTWKILPDGSGWLIRCDDENGFESRHKDQAVAVDTAKHLAMEHRPSQVVIHGQDGAVLGAVHYHGRSEDPDAEDLAPRDADVVGPTA